MKPAINILNQLAHFLLILLWVYASFSKLLNFELSKGEMLNQVLPDNIAIMLTWLVPVT